jgi:hypothetical protein
MNLYEISTEMQALNDLLEETGGEITETVEAWQKEFGGQLMQKVDGYGALIKHLDSYADAIKSEEVRLNARRKVFENRVQRLKDMAGDAMRKLGVKKIEGEKFTLSICQAGGKQALNILDEKGLPERYFDIIPQTLAVNKDRIRDAIETDEELKGKAELLPRGEYVKLK